MKGARQIHCLLDCLSVALEEDGRYDCRPQYFGVWNSPFSVTDQGISYYSGSDGLRDSIKQFELLYGRPDVSSFKFWFDPCMIKHKNFALLEEQLKEKENDHFVIILVDLYHLPHSNFCYQLKHRPHVLMVDHLHGSEWYLKDPYFDWAGYVTRETMLQAFCCQDQFMGITLSTKNLRAPEPVDISCLFAANFNLLPSQIVLKVEVLVQCMMTVKPGVSAQELYSQIEQVGIIVKRMAGYQIVFSYFAEELDFEVGDRIASKSLELAKAWESLLLSVLRLGILQKQANLHSVKDKLKSITLLEYSIKKELWDKYVQWVECYDDIKL